MVIDLRGYQHKKHVDCNPVISAKPAQPPQVKQCAMSGETTNYLGIILAVAGLFFVVVCTSIFISCVKCCKKQLMKKPALDPDNIAKPGQKPSQYYQKGSGSGYGSTSQNVTDHHQTNSKNRQTHRKLGQSRSVEYNPTERRDYSIYNIEAGSEPDLKTEQHKSMSSTMGSSNSKTRSNPRNSLRSFESFGSSSVENGLYSSSNSGPWHTPECGEENKIFYTLPRQRHESS